MSSIPPPPEAPPIAYPGSPPAAPLPAFDLGAAYSIGWEAFVRNYGILVGCVAIYGALELASLVLQTLLNFIPVLGTLVSLAVTILFFIPLQAGMAYMGVKVCRREPLGVGDLFLGFSRYWQVVGIGVLQALISMACIVPFACLGGIAIGVSVAANRGRGAAPTITGIVLLVGAMLLACAVVIAIMARLSFSLLVCLDPGWGGPDLIESMKISWRITRRDWGMLVLLNILNGLIVMGSLLLLLIGALLLGAPLVIAVTGAAYCLVIAPYFSARCLACGYDLTGLASDRCPECGTPIGAEPGAPGAGPEPPWYGRRGL